ncbi:hypothetical protein ONZ45_g204 [Pleurotus djamor]|nr:hypothetical protein ONZ45_g204 [Pleurotus djamor]
MHQPLPSIPTIDDPRLYLDVYTHRSVKVARNDEYGDNERLATLGEKVFSLAVTNACFTMKPMLDAKTLEDKINEYTSTSQIEKWVEWYNLKSPLVFTEESTDLVNSPKACETCFFFHSYLGAIFIRNGFASIQHWCTRLINPSAEPTSPPPVLNSSSTYGPTQPSSSPPPLPPSPAKATPSSGILQLLNQTAVQRNAKIEYNAAQEGPPHQPIWTVQCIIDGVIRGMGQGRSQKVAKEDAAKKAWGSLDWL